MTKETLEKSSLKYRTYCNKGARKRDMEEGEKVLVLLPTSNNKLLMQWRGLHEIVKKIGNAEYRINMNGKRHFMQIC
jgi:hypothetical protein